MTPHTSDMIDAWLDVRAQGYTTLSSAAGRLNVKPKALEYAIKKAREANDPRIPEKLRKLTPGFEDVMGHHPRMAAAVRYSTGERAAAVRCVANNATDVFDLAELLDALGLTATEGRP